MTAWIVFILGGLVTFAFRSVFIIGQGRFEMPEAIQDSLRYVAPAAFAAISIPLAFNSSVTETLKAPTPEIIGLAVGLVVMYRTRSMGMCLSAAIGVWAVLTYVI